MARISQPGRKAGRRPEAYLDAIWIGAMVNLIEEAYKASRQQHRGISTSGLEILLGACLQSPIKAGIFPLDTDVILASCIDTLLERCDCVEPLLRSDGTCEKCEGVWK